MLPFGFLGPFLCLFQSLTFGFYLLALCLNLPLLVFDLVVTSVNLCSGLLQFLLLLHSARAGFAGSFLFFRSCDGEQMRRRQKRNNNEARHLPCDWGSNGGWQTTPLNFAKEKSNFTAELYLGVCLPHALGFALDKEHDPT